MKTKLFFSVAILAALLFTACESKEVISKTTDKGVVINGVKWATRNLESTGTFADKPTYYGRYFQWNKKNNDNFMSFDEYFASNFPNVTSWLSANDPCPKGWRVPTLEEMKKLLDINKVTNERITLEGNILHYFYKFTDKTSGNNILMSCAGFLNDNDSILYGSEQVGLYWSSTEYSVREAAYCLRFLASGTVETFADYKAVGLSVRCVAE